MNDWQNRIHSFSERASYMLEKKILSDCEFMVADEKFQCHKLILAMASPVFQAMFYSYSNKTDGPIDITDIQPEIFLQMLHFIYGINIKIQSHLNACELYYAAKKYFLTFLERECIEYLQTNLNNSNVLQIYEFAKFHNEKALRKQCIVEIQLHTTEILKSKNASNVTEETLSSILDFNTLNVHSEAILFQILENWTLNTLEKEDLSSSVCRSKSYALLTKIRFLTLSIEEFANDVAKSKLLTDGEKLDILLRITNAVNTPMENGLCELKEKRRPVNIKLTTELDIKTKETLYSLLLTKEKLDTSINKRTSSLMVKIGPIGVGIYQDFSNARCDGSEWLTSIFKVHSPMDLIGVEVRMQANKEEGEYIENVMVKVAEAYSKIHFAEGSLYGPVPYNSKSQVIFNVVAQLKPDKEYALHVFLCRPGMYPIGRHDKLSCENGSVAIDFISHSSWEGTHPFNTTVLSSVIHTDPLEEEKSVKTEVM